ncbi:MAG: sugar phosphate isomerase/epimerase family protein [Kiritimatiellia bacterium]|nr:sugar phosphate isomerase/epimerase family protein [Kiritimatiellia bacterium]
MSAQQRLKTGAFLSSFRLDFKSALKKAQEIGLAGIQLSSLKGEIDVKNISPKKAREIIEMFKEHNLVISAVCGDIGGFAVDDESEAKKRIERTKKIMDNTRLLGVTIVQTHIGFIPENFNTDRKAVIMRKCLEEVGKYGEKTGVFLATETGPESASTMKRFLDTIRIPAIKVNYDPANLAMNGFDCIGGVRELQDYIIHSHAKDGRKIPDEKGQKEQPLGKGDVNFPEYIKAMGSIGYNGFYVIEREVGEDPARDIAEAKRFLEQF